LFENDVEKIFLSIATPKVLMPVKNYFIKTCFALLLVSLCGKITSTSGQGVEKVYSVFILNFARTIQWPAEKATGDFTIGILNSPKVADELRAIAATKNIGTQKIKIKEYTNADQVEGCHILFLPSLKASLFSSVVTKIAAAPTLIVTDTEGLASRGGGINFLTVDNKMKFELNSDAIEKRGLKVPASLKTLGIPVQ
jgi:hypothetical protein